MSRAHEEPTGRELLKSPGFPKFLGGYTSDLAGDYIWFVLLAWTATELGGPGIASVVVAIGSLPRLALMLVSGSLIDRYGVLRIAQLAQSVRIWVMVAALLLSGVGLTSIPLLMALALVFGIADALRLPAAATLPAFLLSNQQKIPGQGLVQFCNRMSSVIGAPIAGAAIALGELPAGAATVLVCTIFGWWLFRGLGSHLSAVEASQPGGRDTSIRSGLRHVWGNRPVFWVVLVVTCFNLVLLGPLNIGIMTRAHEHSWEPHLLGAALGVFGLFSAIGALCTSRLPSPKRPLRAGATWALIGALGIAGLALGTGIGYSMACLALVGCALGPSAAPLVGYVQSSVPNSHIGRVMSVLSFASLGLTPLALIAFGQLTAWLGVDLAFFLSGASAAMVICIALCVPSLRSASLANSTPSTSDPTPPATLDTMD